MSREYRRKTPGESKRITLARGSAWQTSVDAEEIRLREGTVDEKGMRNIEYVKDDSGSMNRATCLAYEKMGYTRSDKGDYIIFSIPDDVYKKKIEAKQHEMGLKQVRAHKTPQPEAIQNGFIEDSLEVVQDEPETVGPRDLMNV